MKSIKTLKKKLWKIFSQYIRNRDRNICISCGQMGNHAGHFASKGSGHRLLFDERNVNCQCAKCNTFLHGNLWEYGKALDRKYGPGTADSLLIENKTPKKWTVQELEDMIEYYKEKLKPYTP
jgi:hypothetical protein